MPPVLSKETMERVNVMYPSELQPEVIRLLVEECGHNLPGSTPQEDEFSFERIRFAALKVSNGDINILRKAISLAKEDYRELLGAAGFASSITKHKNWMPTGQGSQPEGFWTKFIKGRYFKASRIIG